MITTKNEAVIEMSFWTKYGSALSNRNKTEVLRKIEERVKISIPEDYCQFIINHTGFENHIGKEFVVIWDLDELIEFNTDYEVFNLLQDGFGIGSNGSSEMIALKKVSDCEHKILLIPYLDLDEDETYIEIGDSFTDMLLRLESGIEWFD